MNPRRVIILCSLIVALGISFSCSTRTEHVAAAVDDMEFEDVVGSIAGDDTIMLAVKNREKAAKLCVMLRNMVKE